MEEYDIIRVIFASFRKEIRRMFNRICENIQNWDSK